MHAGVAGRMHVGLNQELHSVAAIGVVVRLGVAWQIEEVPGAAVCILLARRGVPKAGSIHVRHRLCDLVSQHADHAICGPVAVHGLADGR